MGYCLAGRQPFSSTVAATSENLHIHVVNDPEIPKLFELTEDQMGRALAAAPDLKEKIRVTIRQGDDGLREAMLSADVLVGWQFRPREYVTRAPKLRWIHIIGAGIEHLIPIDWLPPGAILYQQQGCPCAAGWGIRRLCLTDAQ